MLHRMTGASGTQQRRGHPGQGMQRGKWAVRKPPEHPSLQSPDLPASPLIPKPGTHLCCDPASHPTLCGPVWVLVWGCYLHSPKELILDVAAPKLLLHRGPCGGIQHLQPHLKGRGHAVRPLLAGLPLQEQAGGSGWDPVTSLHPAESTAQRQGCSEPALPRPNLSGSQSQALEGRPAGDPRLPSTGPAPLSESPGQDLMSLHSDAPGPGLVALLRPSFPPRSWGWAGVPRTHGGIIR